VFVNIDRNLGIHLDSDEVLDFLYYMIGQTQSLAPFCTATTTSATTSVPSTSVLTAGEQGDASSTTTAEDEEDPVKEAIEKLKLERSSELEKLRLENSRLKRQQQMSFQRVPRASMSSLMLSSVRNRCHELFNNEGHDPRMCFDCKHCDHAAWPVDIHEDGDDRSNGRKRKRTVKSAHPTQDAVIRNRIYYHGRKEDYSKLEYPFCAMDESSILETQDLFQCIANDFNQRYRGAASKPGEEHLLVLQLIELQKTINDVYMILNEGERVMTDGVLGRCTIRHLSAVGRLVEKHRNFVNNKNIPGLERVISAARILNKCETKYAASSGPTSRVVEEVGQDDDDDI